MTLIEVIVVLAIFTIVLGMTSSLFQFGNKVFYIGNDKYDVQHELRMASDYISNKTQFATRIALVDIPADLTAEEAGYNYFYVQDGKLNHDMWDSGTRSQLSMGSTITGYDFSSSSEDVLSIDLESEENGQTYTINTAIALPNIRIHPDETINASGQAIKYSTDALYAYNGDITGDPEDPEDPEDPDDPDAGLDPVLVTIVVPKASYTVTWNGVEIEATSPNGKEFAIPDVEAGTYTLSVWNNKGQQVIFDQSVTVEGIPLIVPV